MPRADQRTWLAAVAAAVALALVTGGGCGKVTPASGGGADGGGNTDGQGQADVPLTADEACTREAQAICDKLGTCAMVWVQYLYGDKATCVSRTQRGCLDEQRAPGVNRTTGDLAVCARDVASATCPDLLAFKFPASCQVKPGTVENGVACGSDWQCQSAYCSKKDGDCGVCAPRVALAGDCTADQGCQQGMVCANNKCAVPAELEGMCNPPNQPCRGDLYCTNAGKCTAKLGAGAMCQGLLLQASDCDILQGYLCNGLIGGSCAKVTVAKAGEACGGGSNTVCMDLNPCVGSTANVMGVCANPAGDGEACGTAADNRNCVPPANCKMGVCRLPSAPNCR